MVHKKNGIVLPLVAVFVFMTVMVIYVSTLMYSVAVSNSNAVMEDRILTVSAMINNHLNTAENVLHVAGDSVHHMQVSGASGDRIHEFLVDETVNIAEQFDENYTGIYGYIKGEYLDGLNWVPPDDYDPKTRDWYKVAKDADGEAVFSSPYIDAQTGNLIISACRMLPDRQSVIALDVQLKGIQDMMSELTISNKGYGFVVNEDGRIIAHRDEDKKGSSIYDMEGGSDFLDAVFSAGFGNFSYSFGKRSNTVYVNNIANDWYVVMVVSDRELYSEVRNQSLVVILICILIFSMISTFYIVGYKNEQKYRKRMEEMRLEEQRAAYDRKVLEIEKDVANASNKAKSDFLAKMSHEIRTPMNAILGMDEMILRSKPGDTVKKYALDIQSAGNTLLSIINDILDFSKIESGRMELIPVEYSFASVMNDVANMTMKKAEDKGLIYNLDISKKIPSRLKGDEIRVRQVMLNLINNAIKYTHEGSVSVSVVYDKPSGMLIIAVSDTGIGIKDEDIGKLFGLFQRLDEDNNRNIEGTGLGLNITMRLVKSMGGDIEVHSVYGKGTTFTACMKQEIIDENPIGDFANNLMKVQEDMGAYVPTLIAPDAGVLVVDDNDMNLEVIEGLLVDTRIQITTAESGSECIDILKEKSFDVIFLDQMMPVMSGTRTLEKIKADHLADDVPVIALTADTIVGAREKYIKEGFTDYLSKPVMYDELEALLEKYIDRKKIKTEEEIKEEQKQKAESSRNTVVIAISESTEMLKELKFIIGSRARGVFVKDKESAIKYLKK